MDIRVLRFKTKVNRFGVAEDWVEYGAAHSLQSETTWERVRHLIPPDEDPNNPRKGMKAAHMRAVWSFIEPHYKAWKDGRQMPESGTPLSAWPGVGESEIFELNRVGIKSVEDLANSGDAALDKIPLPSPREMRKQAKMFLEGMNAASAAAMIANLQAQIEELKAAKEPPKRRGRPPKAEGQSKEEDAA